MSADLMIEHNDKRAWCEVGARHEIGFIKRRFANGVRFDLNEEKKTGDIYAPDLRISAIGDLKMQRVRFRTAYRYGIDPKTAVTLNAKDIKRYAPMSALFLVVFDIDYGDFKSVRCAPMREIKRLISKGIAKPFIYKKRLNDKKGNARMSYVFDALWFAELKENRGGQHD